MAYLTLEMQCDDYEHDIKHGTSLGYCYGDDSCSVRIANGEAENGCEQSAGPLNWLNSARLSTDIDDDAVHCVISIGDPRGGFCFTVRRCPDGKIVIHMPHPNEGMAHMRTKQLHDGTLVVVGDSGEELSFADSDDDDSGEEE